MSTAILRLQRAATHTIKNKISSAAVARINWKLVYVISFIFCLGMLVLYIIMVNQLTRGAYLIRNYNRDIQKLTAENKTLEASFAQSNFLEDVGRKARDLSFEKTTNVKYIQMLQNSLAEATK